jgi:hypothetical protein
MTAGGSDWPVTDTTNHEYVMDRKHYLREVQGTMAEMLAALEPAGKKKVPATGEHAHHQH